MRVWWIIVALVCYCSSALAMSWSDLWWRKDQQGMHLLQNGKNEQAANTFQSQPWKAVAHYRSRQYQAVENDLNNEMDPISKYNLGNALALQGKYQDAINAYEQAIKQQPEFKDAIYNRDLIKKLIQQQQQKQNNKEDKNKATKSEQKQQNEPKNSGQGQQENNQQSNNSENSQQNKQQDSNDQQQDQKDQQNQSSQPQQDQGTQQPPDTKQGEQKDPQKNQDNDSQNSPAPAKQQKENATGENKSTEKDNENNPSESALSSNKGNDKPGEFKNGKAEQKKEIKEAGKEKLDQETDQWLQQIPDDPSDLLRRKILRDHLKKINQG